MNTLGRWKTRLIGLGLLLAPLGCQTGSGARNNDLDTDPLLGGPGAAGGLTNPRAAAADPTAQVPAMPTAQTPMSNAALAVTAGVPSAPTAVTLDGPRPLGQTGTTPGGVITPVGATSARTAAAPSGLDTFEGLQQALKARGVNWQQLSMTTSGKPDEWHFICSVPKPGTPGTTWDYEITRSGPNGLAAMRAVLDQIIEAQR